MFKNFVLILAVLFSWQVAAVRAAEIIVVTENVDKNLDRIEDDQELIDWLRAEGHSVDVRRNTWDILNSNLIAQLNAADLIIVSRLAGSGLYIHSDEPTQWNSVKTPLLLMSAYFARNNRWNWVNSETATNNTPNIFAEAIEPEHPVFRGVSLMQINPSNPDDPANVVQVIDPLVGSGITSFIDTADMGNGRLIATPVGKPMGWIAEWDAGVEFYEGAGQFAEGKRMLFCAGTYEIRYSDPDRRGIVTNVQGELNLTSEGLQMFRNAINYLLSPESEPDFKPGTK